MTHDILQSDITLVAQLIADQRPDGEILKALAHRSVDSAKAAQLLDDLRNGRKPAAASLLSSEMTMSRRSRSRKAGHESSQGSSARSPQAEPHRERTARAAAPGRGRPAVVWIVAASLFVLAVVVSGIVLLERNRSRGDAADAQPTRSATARQGQTRSTVPGAAVSAAGASSSALLALELQPDGLHIGGILVTGSNVLPAIASSLGAPTRTNQATPAGTVVYAYDNQGLLIYAHSGGGTNHIVLDCEATGGANGTTYPFAGTLRVEDQVVGADTDSKTLASIKKLGLSDAKGGGTIWGGHYHGLELVFAYLKTPRRPSLIEIDLK